MKNIFYTVLVVMILALGYAKWKYGGETEPIVTPTPTTSPLASSAPAPPSNLINTYSTPYFELEYPAVATATEQEGSHDSLSWRVSYMGDVQKKSGRTQTELFDGYSIEINRYEAVGDDLQQTQAESDRQGIIDACGEENVTDIHKSSLNRYNSLSFEGGCLGEAVYNYLIFDGTLYRVTTFIAQPEEQTLDYQDITDTILESLTFKLSE